MWARQRTNFQLQQKQHGFTIVELLIVIVVIGILASVTVTAYNGVQGRARDTQRLSDMRTIAQALEIYKINTGNYPPEVSTATSGWWEVSTDGTSATNFLSALMSSSGVSKIPVDPINKGDPSNLDASWSANEYEYFYYRYAAGAHGCDASRGAYYVLGVTRMDTVASGTSAPSSPNWSCSGKNWNVHGAWVTGSYTD